MPPIPYGVASDGTQLWTHSETIPGVAGDVAPLRSVPPGTPSQQVSFGFSFADPGTTVVPANARIWSATPELHRVRSSAFVHQYNFGATYNGYGFPFASFTATGGGTAYDNWYRMDGAFVQTGDGVGTNTPPRPPLDRDAVFSDLFQWHAGWANTADPSNPLSPTLQFGPTSVPAARLIVVWYYPEGQGPDDDDEEPPEPPPDEPPPPSPPTNPPPTTPPPSTTPTPTPGPPLPPTPTPTVDCCDGPPGRPPVDPNNPASPRQPPGGSRPWTPRCTGDGTVGSYATASAGESMVGVRDPRVSIEIQFREFADDNTETEVPAYWSVEINHPDPPAYLGGFKKARAFSISPMTRALSDDNGNYVGSQVDVRLDDKDRAALRTRLGSATGKYVWEREGVIRIQSEAGRRAQTHRELFRGLSKGVSLENGFKGALRFEDAVATQFGKFGPDQASSSRLFTTGLCSVKEMIGKPMQWIFGEVSDHGTTDPTTGLPAAKGLVPLWLINTQTINGTLYDVYHLAAHAVASFDLYGTNLSTMADNGAPPSRTLLDLDALGAAGIILAPGHTGWPFATDYLDITDPGDGTVHRVTHIFVQSGSAYTDAHKNGNVTFAANVCGVEDVGNGTGDLIGDLFSIYQFIFEHLILPDTEYHTGNYPGSPQWADGRYMVHSASFAAAQAYSVQRIGGRGYQGAFVLGGGNRGQVTRREFLRRASNTGDCWFVWSHGGQVKVCLMDDTADITATPIFREAVHLREMPTPKYDDGAVENPVLYNFDWDDDLQRYRGEPEQARDAIAIGRMGNRDRPSKAPVDMRFTRDAATAADVAQRRLLRRKYPPAYYPVELSLDGVDIEPGDIIRINSQEGVGTGSDNRPLFVTEWTYDHSRRRALLIGRDLTDILAEPAELLSGGEAGEAALDPDVLLLLSGGEAGEAALDPDVMVLR